MTDYPEFNGFLAKLLGQHAVRRAYRRALRRDIRHDGGSWRGEVKRHRR